MGLGSIGNNFLPYEESNTFISPDAGVMWQMTQRDANKYEFGDMRSILVLNDEDRMDNVRHCLDLVKSRDVRLHRPCLIKR